MYVPESYSNDTLYKQQIPQVLIPSVVNNPVFHVIFSANMA